MATKFITNKDGEPTLSERIQGLTKASAKLDFLVGYFFFSGFCEIYKDLKDKPLRILVGMDADVNVNNFIQEFYTDTTERKQVQKLEIRRNYFETVKKAINKADLLDNKDFENSYKLFVEKLDSGTLEIRKTKDPNHAKMYLFNIPPENTTTNEDSSKVIIGSSNFSLQGFKGRNEVNVYLQDDNDYKDAQKIFDELWADSIQLVDASNKEEFKQEVLAHTWLETVPSPYLMYVRVLYEYFKVSKDYIKTPKELTKDRMTQFFDVSYQIDAIRDGVAKIKKHSGVIVADVVGLGKSVIASAIAANLDCRTLIITPPHLKQQWEEYSADFGLRGCQIYTSGKLEEAAHNNANASDLVVIIDEAHRYRSEYTEAYGYLHQICAGNKVVLLSATPFNNRPEDIFSLIKLFQIPAHSTIQTVNNLGIQMEELVKEYKELKREHREKKSTEKEFNIQANALAERIREILDPVVIRRTRIDLEKLEQYKDDLKSQRIEFSEVQDPKSQTYDLGELSDLYIETLDSLTGDYIDSEKKKKKLQGFIGARYKPLTYLKKDTKNKDQIDKKLINKYKKYFDDVENFASGQRNMAKFMKQLLVRRFESSKYSFLQSLRHINNSMLYMKRFYTDYKRIPMAKKAKLPDLDDLDNFIDDTSNGLFSEDQLFELYLQQKNNNELWFIDAEDIEDSFIKELDLDIDLISGFLTKWEKTKTDPKLDNIAKTIKSSLKKEPVRKIIIFTEFSDTADYLADELRKRDIRAMMYSSKVASKGGRSTIRENFDAGYSFNLQKNDYDVLVATDAISEGYSLHRAGTIYNYDIPYNPTRVIQRVGRINRINKKMFDKLYIYNFFPTATGEEISHTAEISTFKMKLFQAILGADTKILTKDETIDGYLGRTYTEEENAANSVSWDVEFRNELFRIKKDENDILQSAINLPQRCRVARENENYKIAKSKLFENDLFDDLEEKGVLLFSKKGDAYRFCFANQQGGTVLVSPQQAITLFKASKDTQGEKVSDGFYAMYERAKTESGLVKTSKTKSQNSIDAITRIKMMIKLNITDNDKEYLRSVADVISWDSIPTCYIKKITKLDPSKIESLAELKIIIPDKYLETIIMKDSKVGSEPETILLAEELL